MLEQVRPRESVPRVLGEETLEEILEHRSHVLRPAHRVFDDEGDQLEDTVCVERGLAGEELVQDTAQGPAKRIGIV